MPKILKRFLCKHTKTKYVGTILDDVAPNVRKTKHIWKCENCGKELWGK